MKKRRPVGQQFGLACLVFGAAGVLTNIIAMQNDKIFTVVMILTPMLLLSGLGFLIVPGQQPPAEIPEKDRPKYWWKHSKLSNRLFWILSGLLGLFIGFWLMITLTDFTTGIH